MNTRQTCASAQGASRHRRARRWAASTLATLVATATPTAAQVVEYYHLDALGSVRAVSNQAGQLVERHDYLPFGEECNAPPCAPVAGTQTVKFTGKERDAESGLDYFGARYYGAKLGRFTTIDPVYTWQENLLDPQRWNRYAYVRNNPQRYVDPDGRAARPLRTAAEKALFEAARERAIRRAWRQERIILEMFGPEKMSASLRNISKAEQEELLTTGSIKGWIGHHIFNVADHDLELAGDPNNIKFVKGVDAHKAEHGGKGWGKTVGELFDRPFETLKGFLGMFVPAVAYVETMEDGVELGGAAADELRDMAIQGPIGRHIGAIDGAAARPEP